MPNNVPENFPAKEDRNVEDVASELRRSPKWVRTHIPLIRQYCYRYPLRKLWIQPRGVDRLREMDRKESKTGGISKGQKRRRGGAGGGYS